MAKPCCAVCRSWVPPCVLPEHLRLNHPRKTYGLCAYQSSHAKAPGRFVRIHHWRAPGAWCTAFDPHRA